MSPRRLTWGVTLAGVGVILLLTNLQLISWSVWLTLLSLWPVLLVSAGIRLAFRGSRLALVGPLLIVAAMAYAVAFPGRGYLPWMSGDAWDAVSEAVVHHDGSARGEVAFSQTADAGVRALRLNVDFGAGDLELNGGPADTEQLYDATLEYSGVAPKETFAVHGTEAVAELRGAGSVWDSGRDWSIGLTEKHRVYLDVEAAACSAHMDLASVELGSLRVHCGASDVAVELGQPKGRVPVDFQCGASSVELNIPRGAQVRVRGNTVVGSMFTDRTGLVRQGNYWVSRGFDSAKSSYDVTVSNGVGEFRLHRDA